MCLTCVCSISRNASKTVECPYCKQQFAIIDSAAEQEGARQRGEWDDQAAAEYADDPALQSGTSYDIQANLGMRINPTTGVRELLIRWAPSYVARPEMEGFDAAVEKVRKREEKNAKKMTKRKMKGVQEGRKMAKLAGSVAAGADVSQRYIGWNVYWPPAWDDRCRDAVQDADRHGRITGSRAGVRSGSVWWRAEFNDAADEGDGVDLTRKEMQMLEEHGYLYNRPH